MTDAELNEVYANEVPDMAKIMSSAQIYDLCAKQDLINQETVVWDGKCRTSELERRINGPETTLYLEKCRQLWEAEDAKQKP